MLRDTLLTAHILAVVVWMGCGIYERFIHIEIQRARGSLMEVPLLRIYSRYAGLVVLATLVVAGLGGWMSWSFGWGFFNPDHLWLSLKQGIMLLILVDMLFMLPLFVKSQRLIAALPDDDGRTLEDIHRLLARLDRHLIPVRIGATAALVLAVFRP